MHNLTIQIKLFLGVSEKFSQYYIEFLKQCFIHNTLSLKLKHQREVFSISFFLHLPSESM